MQTQAPLKGLFGLYGTVLSPYFPYSGAAKTNNMAYKALVTAIVNNGPTPGAVVQLWDGSGTYIGDFLEPVTFSSTDTTSAQYQADIVTGVIAGILSDYSVTLLSSEISFLETILNTSATSYQTIVSQTGTGAPTAGITPISTYASGTTFTWARTGAGVYTLTASTAVFSTTKTAVFISPLTNLNAQARGVVTSTTVITFTTAIGSLLGLGLLGFTATNTDALLSNTMVYVQTYS